MAGDIGIAVRDAHAERGGVVDRVRLDAPTGQALLALPEVTRIIRHGELRLLVTAPRGNRCLLGYPIAAGSNRYQFMAVRRDSLFAFELGLRSLRAIVATGRPIVAVQIDVASARSFRPSPAGRRSSNTVAQATGLRQRLLNAVAHGLTQFSRRTAL